MALTAARPCSFSLIFDQKSEFPAKPGWSDLNQGSNNLKRCRCYQCSWGPDQHHLLRPWWKSATTQHSFFKVGWAYVSETPPNIEMSYTVCIYIIFIFHTYIYIYIYIHDKALVGDGECHVLMSSSFGCFGSLLRAPSSAMVLEMGSPQDCVMFLIWNLRWKNV